MQTASLAAIPTVIYIFAVIKLDAMERLTFASQYHLECVNILMIHVTCINFSASNFYPKHVFTVVAYLVLFVLRMSTNTLFPRGPVPTMNRQIEGRFMFLGKQILQERMFM